MLLPILCLLAACSPAQAPKKLADMLDPKALYKMIQPQDYVPSSLLDCVNLTTLDRESGFIHASYSAQVESVLNKFFGSAQEMMLLQLDVTVLAQSGVELRPEANKPDGTIFPHLYGVQKIPAAAVIKIISVVRAADGSWTVK